MNDEEYDELFRTAYPRLVALGLATSTERYVAQELAQETLLRAYHRRDELAVYDSPLAWCRRVMGNLLIDQHRSPIAERAAMEKLQSRTESRSTSGPGSGVTDPAELAVSMRWAELVAPLGPRQRLVATLYYAEDQSVEDVAEALEIATGTVQTALSKARRTMRHALGSTDDGPIDGTFGKDARS